MFNVLHLQEWADFLDSAEKGVFLLSLGNSMRRIYRPDFFQRLLDVFETFRDYKWAICDVFIVNTIYAVYNSQGYS